MCISLFYKIFYTVEFFFTLIYTNPLMTGLFENIRNKVVDNLNEGKGRAPLRSLFSSASAMESDLIITRSSQKEERQFTEVPIFDNIASESNGTLLSFIVFI